MKTHRARPETTGGNTQKQVETPDHPASGKAIPDAPIFPPTTVIFYDLIEKARNMTLDQAIADLDGIRELIWHHPGFGTEAIALDMIIRGWRALVEGPVMNQYRREFERLPSNK